MALALGAASVLFFCPAAPLRAGSSGVLRREVVLPSPPDLRARAASLQPASPEPKEEVKSSEAARTPIQSALERVKSSNLQELAGALGLNAWQINSEAFGTSEAGMKVIGDLDGDGIPEVCVNWQAPEPGGDGRSTQAPSLYLLSWDGKGWRASHLIEVVNAFEVLPGIDGAGRLIAVVVFRGATATPYPVIFQFQEHAARRLWDGRSDSSLYTGFDYGAVQFKKMDGEDFPDMLSGGRADPGLLVFPRGPGEARRGFQETITYAWRNGAYVPVETAYSSNPDYTLYRFIAALHLHDFMAAYALIEPREFLKTAKPTLKLFREHMEENWPEFLDDQIFQVPGRSGSADDRAFTLTREDGKVFLYRPRFTAGPAFLLSGLHRKEVSE